MSTETLTVDHVKTLRDALATAASAKEMSQEALWNLHLQAIEEVKIVFSRLFWASGAQLPEWEIESAIPSTWDNLRLDFSISQDVRLKVDTIIDPDTWISFFGMKVDGPVEWIHFQVRVPLKHLSSTGIEKV